MYKIVILSIMASAVIATADFSPALIPRQLTQIPCSQSGLKDCGTGCINFSWTCCPGGAGGCPPTKYCTLGTNGEEGCCPNGEKCTGPGGVTTTPGATVVSTSTSFYTNTLSRAVSTSTLTLTSAPTVKSSSIAGTPLVTTKTLI